MATTVDLFCGCGGLTLGAEAAGFKPVVAIDVDKTLTSSFSRNFPETKLLHADLGHLDPSVISSSAPGGVDGVVGGPPCQAFSEMGRSCPDDPRRLLVKEFFRITAALAPKFFVMENVRGLGFERNISVLREGLKLLPKKYTVLEPLLLDAKDFGAATCRSRLFVIGYDRNRMEALTAEDFVGVKRRPTTVRDAISDLEDASYVNVDNAGFDIWRHSESDKYSKYAKRLRGRRTRFTSQKATSHASDIADRFSAVKPGGLDLVGRHARLSWDSQCPTLRAGTGPDRGSYQSVRPIHPRLPRTITVREAARLQGFPDRFVFHRTIWHSFRMIGNSVSPIIAQALLSVIRGKLARR
ncbi:MAG: DNA cytosine methyltransferase [Hyphomonadaceae bacterium]|jgi:DNA (cytosine-5)-methyltransferase 1|nr:DNA cytosine methyltransferase [Hyphomonadaceae bacterium]